MADLSNLGMKNNKAHLTLIDTCYLLKQIRETNKLVTSIQSNCLQHFETANFVFYYLLFLYFPNILKFFLPDEKKTTLTSITKKSFAKNYIHHQIWLDLNIN